MDPETGAHTNAIESTWRHAKHFLLEYCRKKNNFLGHLNHYMFYKSAKAENRDIFEIILEEIVKLKFDPLCEQLYEGNESEEHEST